MKFKVLKISLFSLICIFCIATLFVNLNNDITIYENEEISNQNETYIIKEYDGKVAVFKNKEKTPSTIYESYISLLPIEDQQKLLNGIKVDNTTDLQRIIEDYTS